MDKFINNLKVEISISQNGEEQFEHFMYGTISEAIQYLYQLQNDIVEEYKRRSS